MTETLLFATNNLHKLREVQEIVGDLFKVLSLKDISMTDDIPETSDTLEGNARQKAGYIFEKTGMDCFADDTGLFIDALDGRPGVYSARYAGEGCSFEDNINKVLLEMKHSENRKASFRCVVCLILGGQEHFFEGRIDGTILKEKRGAEGFGYDPVFIPNGQSQTFSEMPPYLKNGLSHRGRAIWKLMKFLSIEIG
ncbi:MAG: RdgB/HAM1 family non-canonical purine NTP pyrophosphatase [Bacteroidetes bacterium]|nr:RdgB/HAM1 family non-canonical purine NTP pyrophosphatase [Bacteroidota bacterium]